MSYNMRVRYANNIITFYEYEKPVTNDLNFTDNLYKHLELLGYDSLDFVDFQKMNNFISTFKTSKDDLLVYSYDWFDNVRTSAHFKDNLFYLPKEELFVFMNNFLLDVELVQMSFEDYNSKEEETEKQQKLDFKILKSNFNAKKDRFIDLVSANLHGNCFFVTLTYNEDNVLKLESDDDLENITISHKRFRKFIEKVSYFYFKDRYALKYIAEWELQKDKNEKNNFTARMAIHYHVFFSDMPVKKLDLDMLRSKWALDGASLGTVNVKRINKNTTGISKYMSKYLLKDVSDLVSSKKSYFSSKNLIRPYNDFVIQKEGNLLYLKNGEIIDLSEYQVEREDNYDTLFTGKTKKITYNRNLQKEGV